MSVQSIDPAPKVRDPDASIGETLKGEHGLVMGVANEQSTAYGCAAKLRAFGVELGPRSVRAFAASPGPLKSRAASGICHFGELVQLAQKHSREQRLADIAEVGRMVAFPLGGAAFGMNGDTIYVDGALHNMA